MKPTIVHLITDLDTGGAERMLTRIVTAGQRSDALRQIVISMLDEGALGPALRRVGIELHCLGMSRNPWTALRGLWRLIVHFRRLRPDVVMTWLYHADLLGLLSSVLAGYGARRVIWNLRCSNMEFQNYSPSTRRIVKLLTLLSPLPAAVAANSRAGLEYHAAIGYRPRRSIYLPNGFDLDEWRPEAADRALVRADLGWSDNTVGIGMVARVDPQKDHGTFLWAATIVRESCPGARFALIGRGTETLEIPLGLAGAIRLLGERDDIPVLIRGFDIMVLSSAYGEGFPNAIGEAMASGIPCVGTDVGDTRALIGQTGRIVPPNSSDALAAAILELALLPTAQRSRLGRLARERVAAEHDMASTLHSYQALWTQVMRQAAAITA